MKFENLESLSIGELVRAFETIGIAQDKADLHDDIAEFNRLFRQKIVVAEELKNRPGDQRRALIKLYDHPNMQVQLNAAKSTLAVAPKRARRQLKLIADSQEYPQAGDAGMSLSNLKSGIFKPT